MPYLHLSPQLSAALFLALKALAIVVLALGRWTVPSAMTLLFLEGLRVFLSELDLLGAVLITCALLIFLIGPGPFSLPGRSAKNEKI